MNKTLYKCTFNWHGAIHVYWRRAGSIARAYFLSTRILAKDLGCTHSSVRLYFNGTKDNYKIEIEKENVNGTN